MTTLKSTPLSSARAGSKNRLAPCPGAPNCVSSLAPEKRHFIEPLRFVGRPEAAYRALVGILKKIPRARIVAKEKDYLHAEFRSGGFGFVDDVEFLFQSEPPVIHVRSASRKGYFDFGVNRKRIESIRKLLTAALSR